MASPPPDGSAPKSGGKGWLVGLAIATLLAVGTGGALGAYMISTVEKAIQDKLRRDDGKPPAAAATLSGDVTLKPIGPVITNLAGPGSSWIRIETSVVIGQKTEHADVLIGEIKQDMIAYLRTASLAQIEGASGLQALIEDLNERAAARSRGAVRKLIIETLVVQ